MSNTNFLNFNSNYISQVEKYLKELNLAIIEGEAKTIIEETKVKLSNLVEPLGFIVLGDFKRGFTLSNKKY